MKFLFLFLMCLSLSCKSQKLKLDTIHKININFNFRPHNKKKDLISFKYHNLVAFTMNANINKKLFQAPTIQQGVSAGMQYDLNTKVHITKKMSFIVRTQVSAASQIASFGLSYKLK